VRRVVKEMGAVALYRVNLCVETDDIRHLDALINYLKAHGLNFQITMQPALVAGHFVEQLPYPPRLSWAERRVLQSLVHHDTIQEAAKACFISRCTARAHLTNAYQKLKVHSLHRALIVAFRQGEITLDVAPSEESKKTGC